MKGRLEILLAFYTKSREIINYLLAGVLTTAVGFATYCACVSTVFNPENAIQLQIANFISWTVAVSLSYFTNRKYVFKSTSKNILRESFSFVTSRIGTLFMNVAITFLGVTIMGFNDKIIKLLATAVVIVANYVFSKIFVFKKHSRY